MKLIDDKTIEDLEYSLGLDLLSNEEKDKILTEILDLVGKRAGYIIVNGFSSEEKKQFESILEGDLEKMEDFMIAKNPEAKNIFKNEAEKIKKDLLNAKIKISKKDEE